jgi:hypothetical protein
MYSISISINLQAPANNHPRDQDKNNDHNKFKCCNLCLDIDKKMHLSDP